MNRRILYLVTGVLILMGLFGCRTTGYKLVFGNSDFKTAKTTYAEGERVKATFDMIATDTDYSFYTDSEDVKLDCDYDSDSGYIIMFTMPAHDVTLSVKSRNTMESLPAADNPEDYIRNENMVFEYYEATVATVGGNESEEYVLYKYDDSRMILALYEKEEGSEEEMDYRLVSKSTLNECMKLVGRYGMRTWNYGYGLDGKKYVVKFMDAGEMIRISSDEMPKNGRDAFLSIREVLITKWNGS